ncbi:MAG: filamentous hemagglutinin N-terminal domain-containing protein [Candidatus Accumulibacter sp.]|jgi:filamentous hemagglutinin family protein|nr:filamentous hemagglutinin N-terminal domain-containing protein [Accumulibacter sp.]
MKKHSAVSPSSFFRKQKLCLIISALLAAPIPVWAAPTDGVVTSGNAVISQSGNTTNINQNTNKAAINWQGFSIAPQETVNFNQPNSSSITLNRVIGNERSVIEGALNANGKVFLINSNGVLFAQGSSVNTAGLVASTLNITDADFTNGNFVFQGNGQGIGQVINLGTIKVTDGGYVALLGDQVRNEGVIIATRGTVALNSGNRISLNFNGDSLVNVSLDEGTLNSLVENKQAILADGGKVILTAKAANDLVGSQVNTSGIIQARTLDDITGTIEVYAHGGTATIDGTLDASAPVSGNGGFIETSGDRVKIADSANIVTKAVNGKSGAWLIDPVDFTVAASGGDVTGALISNYLNNNGNFIISTNTSTVTQGAFGNQNGNGDIFINDIIGWSSSNKFTLEAYRDIRINDAINVVGAGTLVMKYGLGDQTGDYYIRTPASYSGTVIDPVTGYPVANTPPAGVTYGSINFGNASGNDVGGSLYIGGEDATHKYTLLYSLTDLQAITDVNGSHRNERFALAHNLDLVNEGTFGTAIVPLLGQGSIFTGLGHTVSNFTIDSNDANVGLFGRANDATTAGTATLIRDIGVVNATVTGRSSSAIGGTGALVGLNQGVIKNAFAEGQGEGGKVTVTGVTNVGGLVGNNTGSTNYYTSITDSYSTAIVVGNEYVGGLVGYVFLPVGQPAGGIEIIRSHASGTVTGTGNYIGGLVGYAANVNILDSYATGKVTGSATSNYVGGLAGNVAAGAKLIIENSFAIGAVHGSQWVGGLLGNVTTTATRHLELTNSYATGNVSSSYNLINMSEGFVGGLIGRIYTSAASITTPSVLSRVYATGNVTTPAISNVGGLIGHARGVDIKDSYATGNVTVEGGNTGGNQYVGGLVGQFANGDIKNSYATGNVRAPEAIFVGGLAGVFSMGSIESSYATGNVTGPAGVGGLVGLLQGASISDSYAAGLVTATYEGISNVGSGGLVGQNGNGTYDSTITNSYWNESNDTGIGGQGSNSTIDAASSGLTAGQLADAGVRNAIVSDGDVQGAVSNYETRQEQIRQDQIRQEQARQDLIATVASIADDQQASIAQLAAIGKQAFGISELTPVDLSSAIRDFTPSQTSRSDRSYSASVREVTVDGVTFLVDDDEEDRTAR